MGATALPTGPRTLETELNYWQEHGCDQKYTLDFTKAEAEAEYEALQLARGPRTMQIRDIRGHESDFSLDSHGFEYTVHDIPGLTRCKTEQDISDLLIPETEELVKNLIGAHRVATFTHRIRSKSTDDNKRADNKAPALSVHSDFTVEGALNHLKNVITDPQEREKLLNGRVCIINVWRPLKKIERDPLAVCDWKSSNFARDWIAHRFVFPHGWNELGAVKHNPEHRWYYLSEQSPSEPLIFKQFDSTKMEEGGQCVAHSAFVDPAFVDAPARESIEIKMFAFIAEE